MRNRKYLFILFVLLCIFVIGCDIRFDAHESDDVDVSHMALIPYGKDSVDLSFPGATKWYECDDSQGSNPVLIPNESDDTLSVSMQDNEIRYYKAESDNGSKVFYVAKTGLPTVVINTESGKPVYSREVYEPGTIEILAGTNKKGDSLGLEKQDMTIKGRGNSSYYGNKKKGYNFKLESKSKVLGMGKDKKWVLISNENDATKLGNWFASYLAHDIFKYKEWSASFEYVDLIINGKYYGNFILGEAIKLGGKRVDVRDIVTIGNEEEDADIIADGDELDLNGDGKYDIWDGGFIVEVAYNRDSTAQFSTQKGAPMGLKDPDLEEHSGKYSFNEIYYHVRSIMQNVEDFIYDDSSDLNEVFDIESFVDWYMINEIMGNWEAGFHTSVYMYFNPEDAKVHMSSLWDFDRTLRGPGLETNTEDSIWIRQLLSRKDIQQAVQKRWTQVKDDVTGKAITKIGKQSESLVVPLRFDHLRWPESSYEPFNSRKQTFENRLSWFDEYVTGLGK